MTGAPESCLTPLTVAVFPSTMISAPNRINSETCMNLFSKIFSEMTLAPSATHMRAMNWACMSVGNPG